MTFFRFPYGVYSGMLPLLCKATSKVYHWLHIHLIHLVIYIDRSPFAPSPEFEPLCSQFDGSENFLVNCSQSTFCMTRTYRLKLRKGCRTLSNIRIFITCGPGSPDVVIRERGCAKQVYSYQSLDRGQWRTVTTVMEETYSSGCVEDREWAGQLATDTQWCYCDTDRYTQCWW